MTLLGTPAQIYSSALDSVNLINQGQPLGMSAEVWNTILQANVGALEVMVAAPIWTTEDLQPLKDAIIKGSL